LVSDGRKWAWKRTGEGLSNILVGERRVLLLDYSFHTKFPWVVVCCLRVHRLVLDVQKCSCDLSGIFSLACTG
jgi:hypothetical protein